MTHGRKDNGNGVEKSIRTMSNKDLVYTINKIRMEKENPEVYGKHGTTRWVAQSEFWYGHHKDLKDELKRRQKSGLISKRAGKARQEYSFW